jgi:hypothetical protein
MLTARNAVSAAEAAFIADLTDKDINRLVDEEVLPAALVVRVEGRHRSRSSTLTPATS